MGQELKSVILFILLTMLAVSCGSHRNPVRTTGKHAASHINASSEVPDMVGNALIKEARSWIGVPYVWGGKTRDGVDCSGFLMTVFKNAAAVTLPRTTMDQLLHCVPVDTAEMDKGDIIFFSSKNSGGKVSHVGMYAGNGKMIHASSSRGVVEDPLSWNYYKQHFLSAGRVPEIAISKQKKKSDKQQKSTKHTSSTKSAPPHTGKSKTPNTQPDTPATGARVIAADSRGAKEVRLNDLSSFLNPQVPSMQSSVYPVSSALIEPELPAPDLWFIYHSPLPSIPAKYTPHPSPSLSTSSPKIATPATIVKGAFRKTHTQ